MAAISLQVVTSGTQQALLHIFRADHAVVGTVGVGCRHSASAISLQVVPILADLTDIVLEACQTISHGAL